MSTAHRTRTRRRRLLKRLGVAVLALAVALSVFTVAPQPAQANPGVIVAPTVAEVVTAAGASVTLAGVTSAVVTVGAVAAVTCLGLSSCRGAAWQFIDSRLFSGEVAQSGSWSDLQLYQAPGQSPPVAIGQFPGWRYKCIASKDLGAFQKGCPGTYQTRSIRSLCQRTDGSKYAVNRGPGSANGNYKTGQIATFPLYVTDICPGHFTDKVLEVEAGMQGPSGPVVTLIWRASGASLTSRTMTTTSRCVRPSDGAVQNVTSTQTYQVGDQVTIAPPPCPAGYVIQAITTTDGWTGSPITAQMIDVSVPATAQQQYPTCATGSALTGCPLDIYYQGQPCIQDITECARLVNRTLAELETNPDFTCRWGLYSLSMANCFPLLKYEYAPGRGTDPGTGVSTGESPEPSYNPKPDHRLPTSQCARPDFPVGYQGKVAWPDVVWHEGLEREVRFNDRAITYEALLDLSATGGNALALSNQMDRCGTDDAADLGNEVLDTVLDQTDGLATISAVPGASIAVNYTPTALAFPGLAGQIVDKVAQAGGRFANLHIEVTEGQFEHTLWFPTVQQNLAQLRASGIGIDLDDFVGRRSGMFTVEDSLNRKGMTFGNEMTDYYAVHPDVVKIDAGATDHDEPDPERYVRGVAQVHEGPVVYETQTDAALRATAVRIFGESVLIQDFMQVAAGHLLNFKWSASYTGVGHDSTGT